MKQLVNVVVISVCIFASSASADPWKDESGKGKWQDSYGASDRGYERRRERVAIPRGHLPPPGECRNWRRGVPPGHQPPPYRC